MPRFDGTGPLGFGPSTGWGWVPAALEWAGEEVMAADSWVIIHIMVHIQPGLQRKRRQKPYLMKQRP